MLLRRYSHREIVSIVFSAKMSCAIVLHLTQSGHLPPVLLAVLALAAGGSPADAHERERKYSREGKKKKKIENKIK